MLRNWIVPLILLTSTCASAQTIIHGAGSTFVYPIMAKWSEEYHKTHPYVQVSYLPNGSGAGIALTLAGMLDFGGTDAPASDEQLRKAAVKVAHFPVILGADVPAYNLPEIGTQLRLTGSALADIFLGKITSWDDPSIAATNPGVHLPRKPIVVVHRSDGSGTTYIWTDYLSKVSRDWKIKVGKGTVVKWPAGIEGNGNEGVAEAIQNADGALGYIELSYAVKKKIAFGSVQNSDGVFISASIGGIEEAADSLQVPTKDFRVSITNAPGKNAYPIASFSWVLVPIHSKDAAKGKLLIDFLKWVISDGQQFAEGLSYSPLPPAVTKRINSELIAETW